MWFKNVTEMLKQNVFALGTSAYLVTPQIAQQLLTVTNSKMYGQIDAYIAIQNLNYFVTKDRLVDHDYNIYNSTHMKPNVMPILSFVLTLLGFDEVTFLINIPYLTLSMNYPINIALLLYFIILFLNYVTINNIFVYSYLLVELLVFIMLMVKRMLH